MNKEADKSLEQRVQNLEKWTSNLEEDMKSAAVLLRGVDAQADRLLQILDKMKRSRK